MHRLLLVALLAAPCAFASPPKKGSGATTLHGTGPEVDDPPADGPADPFVAPPEETIKPGKRPLLKLHGEPPPEETPEDKVDRPAILPSSYKGVTPGGANLPPRPPRLPVAGPARMTWPGFQIRDGAPTVFIELTSPVEWTVAEAGSSLVYTLKNVTIPLRNNRRVLEVREFHTAVRSIDARPKGRDALVTIHLSRKVAHKERTEEAAGGFKLLVVELSSE
jgi:hypothetical protein